MTATPDLATLPSIALEERKQLPYTAAIYFVLADDDVLYVGQSINLRQRWVAHHRLAQLNERGGCRIAWMTVSDPTLLPQIETALIEHFQPPLNCRRAPASSTTAPEVRPALTPETFRARRLELGLSIERVAALLDVAPSAVESWEHGARPSWGWRYVEWRLTQSGAVASDAVIGQRRRLGMTQAQFAVALGVDVGTVSRWERGAATVTAPGMFWLAIEALKGVE